MFANLVRYYIVSSKRGICGTPPPTIAVQNVCAHMYDIVDKLTIQHDNKDLPNISVEK